MDLSNKWLTRFLILIIILLWGARIVVSNQLATSGAELRSLEKRIAEVQEQNEKLVQEVTAKTSLQYLTEQAVEMGLTETPKLQRITPDN